MAKTKNPPAKFIVDVSRWEAKFKQNFEAFMQQCILDVCELAIMNTPVDTGNLRGQWQPSFGAPASASGNPTDPSGVAAMTRIALAVKNVRAGASKLYVTNGAAYARRLEYGFVGPDSLGRVYNQKGRFYVTRAAKRWPAIVKANAAAFAAKGLL